MDTGVVFSHGLNHWMPVEPSIYAQCSSRPFPKIWNLTFEKTGPSLFRRLLLMMIIIIRCPYKSKCIGQDAKICVVFIYPIPHCTLHISFCHRVYWSLSIVGAAGGRDGGKGCRRGNLTPWPSHEINFNFLRHWTGGSKYHLQPPSTPSRRDIPRARPYQKPWEFIGSSRQSLGEKIHRKVNYICETY